VITARSVNRVNEEIDGLTDEQLGEAIDRLFDAQPEVVPFLKSFSNRDGGIQELATLLSFFVFKVYETEYPGKAATVKREDLESVLDEAKSWIAELDRPEARDNPPPESEPILMAYLMKNLDTHLNSLDGEARLAGYRQRVLLMMMKTIILALDRAAPFKAFHPIDTPEF
jgi:hypothetical protein